MLALGARVGLMLGGLSGGALQPNFVSLDLELESEIPRDDGEQLARVLFFERRVETARGQLPD